MQIDRVMTPDPITIGAATDLDHALQMMDDHDVRHLPVVDDAGSLVGIVSDRDLLGHVGWTPALTQAGRDAHAREPGPQRVEQIMHASVSTVSPKDTVVTVAVDLTVERIGCLPVVEDGRLVGLVSEMDLLAASWRVTRDEGLGPEADPAVTDCMSRSPITVPFDMPVAEVAEVCRAAHVRHVMVADDGKHLRGVISDRDLRAACAHGGPGDNTAGTIMASYPQTLAPGDRMSDAAERMVGHHFSCLPVVDGGELVGVLTLTDMIDHCLSTLRDPEPGGNQK